MGIKIEWAENCSGTEEVKKLNTPAGLLFLFSQQGIINKTEWMVSSCFRDQHTEIDLHINQYFLMIKQDNTIKLLKQGSPYQQKVWCELCKIPFGDTITYSSLAIKINSSARAIGNACRYNPYPLLIPCHRVVSVSGIGGYYGQTHGIFFDIKTKLLNFEASNK